MQFKKKIFFAKKKINTFFYKKKDPKNFFFFASLHVETRVSSKGTVGTYSKWQEMDSQKPLRIFFFFIIIYNQRLFQNVLFYNV